MRNVQRKISAELEYHSRRAGFAWGQFSVGIPLLAALVIVFSAFNKTIDTFLMENRWVAPLSAVGFAGWVKLMRWAGVGRFDPKRSQQDDHQ